MSHAITIDISGILSIAGVLAKLSAIDSTALHESVASLVKSQTQERIDSEAGAPDGSPWEKLSAPYKNRKAKKSSGGILSLEGALLKSLTAVGDSNSTEVGSNLVYAGIHNEGGKHMPQRQFLGLGADNEHEIADLIADHFSEAIHVNR